MAVQQMPTSPLLLLPETRRGNGALIPWFGREKRSVARATSSPNLPTNQKQIAKDARTRAAVASRALRNPMTLAVIVAIVLVSLLSFYIAAYARVTADSFALSALKQEVEAARRVGDDLRAQVSLLSLPGAVHQGAAKLGMQQATPESLQILAAPSSVKPNGSDVSAPQAAAPVVSVAHPQPAQRRGSRETPFVIAATNSLYVW